MSVVCTKLHSYAISLCLYVCLVFTCLQDGFIAVSGHAPTTTLYNLVQIKGHNSLLRFMLIALLKKKISELILKKYR